MEIFHATPPGDLGVFALGLVIAGVVGGLAAGILGVGAGIVIVPVLCHVMAELGINEGIRMHLAVGTSLASTIPAALARAHRSRVKIDWTLISRWSAPMIAGVILGVVLAAEASGRVLATAFAGTASLVALYLLVGSERRVPLHDRIVAPGLIGFASTLTGIGGDATAAPALKLFGAPPEPAVATAAVFALMVALPAALGAVLLGWNASALPPGSFGYVSLIGFALVAAILIPAERAGALLAHLVDLRRLRFVFAALIAVATARMLWDAWV